MSEKSILQKKYPNVKYARNRVIYSRFLGGESKNKLSQAYNISTERISQIVDLVKDGIVSGRYEDVKPYED